MSNATIEGAARDRGITTDQLFREASEGALQHMTPSARAATLKREARRAGALRESRVTPPKATKAASAKTVEPVTEAELEGAFKRMGHDEAAAKTAARGRTSPAKSGSLVEEGKRMGLSSAAAKTFARGRGVSEAVTDGSGFLATDYAYAPDENDSTSWRLLLCIQPGDGKGGVYDPDLVKAAVSAITSTDLGGAPQADVPEADLAKVKQTLAGAWVQAGLPSSEMPAALTQEALRAAFIKRGLSESKATVAAKGRG